MSLTSVPFKKIRLDGGTQSRAAIDEDYCRELAAILSAGGQLPPVLLFFDGTEYWPGDGWHRIKGHWLAGLKHVIAEVRQGTRREAILFSVGANGSHGLRRTNADKRRAVETLLHDEEWGRWSDREIAARCAVDHKTVAAVRRELSGEIPQTRTVERGGTTYAMDVSALTAKQFDELSEEAQLEVLRREDEAAEAAAQRPRREPDDGLRLVSVRLSLLTVQLLDGLAADLQTDRAGMIERALRGWQRKAG